MKYDEIKRFVYSIIIVSTMVMAVTTGGLLEGYWAIAFFASGPLIVIFDGALQIIRENKLED